MNESNNPADVQAKGAKGAKRAQRVVIVMGSERDSEHADKIGHVFKRFGVAYDVRIGSAHKTPQHLVEMIAAYNEKNEDLVFIAVAGRSNALGGFIDFQTARPVISCPPYSDTYAGADVYSSLRMPSGSAAVTAIDPEMAALHALKILALTNPQLEAGYRVFQKELQRRLTDADAEAQARKP